MESSCQQSELFHIQSFCLLSDSGWLHAEEKHSKIQSSVDKDLTEPFFYSLRIFHHLTFDCVCVSTLPSGWRVPAGSYQSLWLSFQEEWRNRRQRNREVRNCGGGDDEKRGSGRMMGDAGEMKLDEGKCLKKRDKWKREKADIEEGLHYVKQNPALFSAVISIGYKVIPILLRLFFNHLFSISFFLSHTLSPWIIDQYGFSPRQTHWNNCLHLKSQSGEIRDASGEDWQ